MALVRNLHDLTIGNVPHRSLWVTNMSSSQRDALDDSFRTTTNIDRVTNTELIFSNDEESANEIADHRLRAKAESDADDASRRK